MLMFAGDPHGDFRPIERAWELFLPDMLVLLGDLMPAVSLEEALFFVQAQKAGTLCWIPGNHDADDAGIFERTFGSELAGSNLHASVIEACGIRLAGLGGKFHQEVWKPPEDPRFESRAAFVKEKGEALRPFSLVTIFPEDIQYLASQRADILVSHIAPSSHPHGFFVLDELASAMGARLVVHAHHHRAQYLASLRNRTLVCGIGSKFALLNAQKGSLELYLGLDRTGGVLSCGLGKEWPHGQQGSRNGL